MAVTQKVKVIALKPFSYGTRRLKAGDELEVMPMDARTMNAMGKTRVLTDADRKPKPKVREEEDEKPVAKKATKKTMTRITEETEEEDNE